MAMSSRGLRHASRSACVRVCAGLATCIVAALAPVSPALAKGATAHVTRVGAAPAGRTVSLALPLKADVSGLERFATAVSTPGSPQYGEYDSIANLARRFGAPADERARVISSLRRAGATGVKIDVTGLFADATLKVSQAQRLFGTALGDFRTASVPSAGSAAARFMAPNGAVHIPASLRNEVTGVVGLDTQPLFGSGQAAVSPHAAWPHTAAAPASHDESSDDESGYLQRTGTASGCGAATKQTGFTPNQYLTAYNYSPLQSAGLQGQGERVALIEIDGFRYSDLRSFSKCFGLATPAINGFGVRLSKPLAPGGESTLDLEVLDAAAPKLKAIDVYESRPNALDVLHSLTAPLSNPGNKPDVISASLGACEQATLETINGGGLRAVEGSLALAAASGISVLASSGDDGSSACLTPSGHPVPQLAVSYPASSPWVTGVGGTNVALNAANQIIGEEVWNDAPLVVTAGGGGLSDLFARPAYQSSFVAPDRRGVPDVSMLADVAPGYEIFCTAKGDCIAKGHTNPWTQVGGTSAAAPLLAGGLALVDQDLRRNKRQNIGLANPLLYNIAHSTFAPSVIADVVANDNDLGMEIGGKLFGCCTAAAGYDDASGLGSVNLAGLAFVAVADVPRIASVGLTLPAQRRPVASEHLLAHVSCSGPCLAGAFTRIQVGRSRKRITERSSIFLYRRPSSRTIKVGLSKATLRTLRAALRKHERITATVFGTILDPSGNVEAQTAGRELRIKH
jgi:subtilase family serine protease